MQLFIAFVATAVIFLVLDLIWLGIIALLVYAPIVVINSGITNYGLVFSTLMYVFQYVESVVMLLVFSVILITFIVDLTYALIDPRLRRRA